MVFYQRNRTQTLRLVLDFPLRPFMISFTHLLLFFFSAVLKFSWLGKLPVLRTSLCPLHGMSVPSFTCITPESSPMGLCLDLNPYDTPVRASWALPEQMGSWLDYISKQIPVIAIGSWLFIHKSLSPHKNFEKDDLGVSNSWIFWWYAIHEIPRLSLNFWIRTT